LLLLLFALFIFPVAVYCTILGMINRRTRPLLVSGTWDFFGILLATSLFLLFLGPVLVLSGAFRENLNDLPFHRGFGTLAEAITNLLVEWWLAWLMYYVLVLGGAAYLLWVRRNTTVIYNVEQRTVETALARLVERLGLNASRLGNRVFLGVHAAPVPLTAPAKSSSHVTANPSPLTPTPLPGGERVRGEGEARLSGPLGDQAGLAGANDSVGWPAGLVDEQVTIDVEPFELLSNVTLHWRSASPTARATLVRELRQELADMHTTDNIAGTWLLGIATLLFLVILMLTTVFVLALFLVRRGS
jgi:hypothetical protein